MDGFEPAHSDLSEVTKRVRKAITGAYPMPTTIPDAYREYCYWQRRRREIKLALRETFYCYMDATAEIRFRLVEELLRVGLRAQGLHDVIARLSYLIEDECEHRHVVQETILKDVQALAASADETVVRYEVFRAAAQQRDAQPAKTAKPRTRPADAMQGAFGF